MAEIWYNIIPCCCTNPDCEQNISASPKVETTSVLISVRGRKGKRTDIVLSAGWARVLAANIDQAANQVKPRIAPKQMRPARPRKNGFIRQQRSGVSRKGDSVYAR